MALRVRLESPYGKLKAFGGKPAIKNGRKGWTTGEVQGKKPMVMFDGRKYATAVPEHWIVYHKPYSRRLPAATR